MPPIEVPCPPRNLGDDIGSPFERTAEIRGGKGIVDHQRQPVLVGDFCYFNEGKDVDRWVAQRFAENQLRVVLDGSLEIAWICRIDQSDLDTQAWKCVVELVVGTAVQRAG